MSKRIVPSVADARARSVLDTFKASEGVYVLGCAERGVTVFNQQVRAHNLIWSLWEESRAGAHPKRIAVVGGGIAGLTAAACALARFPADTKVSLYEQHWDICAIQHGTDNRWLHPKIYTWPHLGALSQSASLPVLNWRSGRASDVAKMIVDDFERFCDFFDKAGDRLQVVLGLRHFRIHARQRRIEWSGSKGVRQGPFFRAGQSEGADAEFDLIIFATGFGVEKRIPKYPTESYWRNEQLGQHDLHNDNNSFVISGFGDGALIDLCRLTVERFRQDTILEDLFKPDLEETSAKIAAELENFGPNENLFSFFKNLEGLFFKVPIERLKSRTRKDVRVMLHISGAGGNVSSFSDIFGPTSSFLNRMMTYLLYRCGAFSISFDSLENTVNKFKAKSGTIICRYGADAFGNLKSIVVDFDAIEPRLNEMKANQAQTPELMFLRGSIPVPEEKSL